MKQKLIILKNSITSRLLRIVFSIYFVLTFIVTIGQMFIEYNGAKDNIKNELTTVGKTFTASLTNAIWITSKNQIENVLSGIFKNPIVIGVDLMMEYGSSIKRGTITKDQRTINIDAKGKETLSNIIGVSEIQLPLIKKKDGKEYNLGKIRLFTSSSVVLKRVQLNFLVIIVNAIIKTIALWFSFLYAFRMLLNLPLTKLIKAAEQIDVEHIKDNIIDIHVSDKNELTILEKALNTMIHKIYLSIKHIDKLNKSLEDKVADRSTQLKIKAAEASDALDRLKIAQKQLVSSEKNAALGELVAGISHEINTPLGISVTAASHLEDETKKLAAIHTNKTMKRTDLLTFIDLSVNSTNILLTNLNRAADLIRNFKQVAVDQTSESKRCFNVAPYLNEVLSSLKPKYKNRNITVEIKGGENIIADSYPGLYSQIISNLIINSLIHGFEQEDFIGIINIDLNMDKDYLTIKYQDNGKGMSKEALEKIFNPFFTTKRGHGGTGLGMHIVFNIITVKLGGEIVCTSEEGIGTIFTIKIPTIYEKNKFIIED